MIRFNQVVDQDLSNVLDAAVTLIETDGTNKTTVPFIVNSLEEVSHLQARVRAYLLNRYWGDSGLQSRILRKLPIVLENSPALRRYQSQSRWLVIDWQQEEHSNVVDTTSLDHQFYANKLLSGELLDSKHVSLGGALMQAWLHLKLKDQLEDALRQAGLDQLDSGLLVQQNSQSNHNFHHHFQTLQYFSTSA